METKISGQNQVNLCMLPSLFDLKFHFPKNVMPFQQYENVPLKKKDEKKDEKKKEEKRVNKVLI